MKNKISKILRNKKIKNIDLLISHAIKKPKEFIYTHPEYVLSFFEYLKLKYYIYLQNKNYPIAYITKHKEFCGFDFYINKNVLVPRPETELMVEEVVNKINNTNKQILLIDVGTGSGCIPISILKKVNSQTSKQLNTLAIDISRKALKIAKKNAARHNVKIKFLYGNLLQTILTSPSPLLRKERVKYDSIIITANLPYLTKSQFKNESSIKQEPKKALVAKRDGLELYKKLLEQIKQLANNKTQITALLEIDPSQTKTIGQCIGQYLPEAEFKIKKDLAQLNRIVKIKLN
jgi:release factor glutamine methyltransferase